MPFLEEHVTGLALLESTGFAAAATPGLNAVQGASLRELVIAVALVASCRRSEGMAAKRWELLKAMLREIFDESAYDRFLARTGNERSVASYRAFTRERESSLARTPRCC